jgi:two-component system, sensor histidine kinase and response regulator
MDSILNVDDYTPGRYARTKVLQQAGFNVREASTGKEALRLISEHNPSLILLDVNLPDMSGFEVCKQIKGDPKTFATTVVHISATNVQSHHQVEGLNCGADSYLLEPIDPSVLIATVKAFFRARQAEEALRRSNEALEQFGFRVAHDLIEPLRTMTTYTELIARSMGPNIDEGTARNLQFVIDAGRRMKAFIDGLLENAHATHASSLHTKLDCEKIFLRVLENLKTSIATSGAVITHDRLPEISADLALEQVFQNLISNAIKYRRPEVKPEIHVTARTSSEEWVFSVRDNGIGIDPADKDHIFQMFHRGHGKEIPGSGIGLALTSKIIEDCGGSIWVVSDPGMGSTFYFTLPRIPPRRD